MTYHCINGIHMYNFGVGSVDVADQLHMQYITDRWMSNRKWWWSIFLWVLGGSATNAYLIYREIFWWAKRNKMYRVTNEISHFQLLGSLSTQLMTFKKRKSQQLRNTSTVSVSSGTKISNYMPLPSFGSRMSHQSRAHILDVWATPISKIPWLLNLNSHLTENVIHFWHPSLGFHVNCAFTMEDRRSI